MRTLLIALLFAARTVSASPLEEGVLQEMNLARTKPASYARFLEKLRTTYRGKEMVRGNVRIVTKEGVKAVNEAIRFLRRQKPLPPLKHSPGLAAAAAQLAAEQSRSGELGHTGRETGGMETRIERHGTWGGSIGENICYGCSDPRDMVMQLIVDVGVPGRGHRKNIFNGAYRETGVSCGPHPALRTVCVIDFAGSFSAR
jgi:uncharacterized protein YkwD